MGTMEKIRQTSPIILAIVAVLFIGFMVVADMDPSTLMSHSDQSTMAVGTVNGEKILYNEFEKRVQEAVENQRNQMGPDAEIDDEPIRQQVWNGMVDEILLRQQAEALGITVSDAELRMVLLEDPPEQLKQPFTDSSGTFLRDIYLKVMTNPATMKDYFPPQYVAQLQKGILQFEDYLRVSRLQEKLRAAVTASSSVIPTTYLQHQYKVENGSADVQYVAVNASTINDQDVKVGDDEVAAYYNKYKEYYKQKPSRKLKYITLKLAPSQQDSTTAKNKTEKLATALQSATSIAARDEAFSNASLNYNGETHDYMLAKDIDPLKYSYISSVPDHEVVGPVRLADGMYFFRVDGRRKGENEQVQASHILINFGNNKDSAKAEANRIYNLAKGGEEFATLAAKYSADPGSAQRGGDLGFFGKGRMVKPFEEAAFGAEIGSIVGPVESQFGFHIIKVVAKDSDEMKFSEIRIAPLMSTATKNQQRAAANEIKEMLETGKSMESIAEQNGYQINETAFFPKENPVLGSMTLTLFAFENDVNDVATPLEVKREGIVVAQVAAARTAGLKPLEDMKEEIRTRLLRQKKLDKIKAKIEDIRRKVASAGSMAAAKALDSSLQIQTATVRENGQVSGLGQEVAFTNAAFTLPLNKLSEPIRGEHAYFVLEVTNRTEADMNAFESKRGDLYKNRVSRLQASAFYRWLNAVKEHADIEDNRLSVYRM